jgi:ubiquinone/menaquinone biosynthesis C-methylase UbiE
MSNRHDEKVAYFDEIGEQYEKINTANMLLRQYSEVHTLFSILGDITGKSVLDLGCSDGFFTRECKRRGSVQTVGVDLSDKMIEVARLEEIKNSLGIEYVVSDVLELGHIGNFDIVITPFLLGYSETKEELSKMCQVIYNNLKQGGRLVSMNNHPNLLPNSDSIFEKYGLTKNVSSPLKDGNQITITMTVENENGEREKVTFTSYYFTKKTIEWGLKNAGFRKISWYAPQISPAGIQKFGQSFWQDFLTNPSVIYAECFK